MRKIYFMVWLEFSNYDYSARLMHFRQELQMTRGRPATIDLLGIFMV